MKGKVVHSSYKGESDYTKTKMFTYLHTYMPETWEAQVKAGFIDENSGIRFPQSLTLEESRKFNNVARTGGELYELIKKNKYIFYIDRLQGGCYFEGYDYDMELIEEYKKMLGDKFWGFQMHEWMSNVASDLSKLETNHCPAWTKKDIEETIQRAFPFPHLFVEAMSVDEWVEAGKPETLEHFLQVSEDLFQKRQEYTQGLLLPCDSYYLAYNLEVKKGAKRLMPEIGQQTPDTRLQVAYARGMAKAYNISFGTYYEPWGGEPFSACNYHKESQNEWNIYKGVDFPFETKGENGGSSRSMQMRMHIYSYMAGAEFISEEWSMCNIFYDWEDCVLTPYGKNKLDFIHFTRKYPDVGKTITPIAVILPKELPAIENIRETGDKYMNYPISGDFANKVRLSRAGLRSIFMETAEMLGTETTSLLNCIVPDALDILHEDCENLDDYQYLVDLTGNADFADVHSNCIAVEDVKQILDDVLPCKVEGGLHHLINKTDSGEYYLTILNNSGVVRTVANGEQLLHEADKTVRVTLKEKRELVMLEGNASISEGNEGYLVSVPAGGWFVGKF